MQDNSLTQTKKIQKTDWKTRIRQMGWAAFFFFLIKGLIWLAVFFGLGSWFKSLI
jgi:hypothetical protein